MAIIRATAVLNKLSGIPRDAARNVWHFQAFDTGQNTLNGIGLGVAAFYQELSTRISSSVSRDANAHRVDLAEVDENGPGAADDAVSTLLLSKSFGLPLPASSSPLPNEVAVALSFRGDVAGVPEEQGLIRPRSRRRGRIFVGPLDFGVLATQATTNEPQVTTAFRELMLDAYDVAHATWLANSPSAIHGIYSRADGLLRPVSRVSVDDEFDTVRRRGQKPGIRMERTVDPAVPGSNRSGVDVVLAS